MRWFAPQAPRRPRSSVLRKVVAAGLAFTDLRRRFPAATSTWCPAPRGRTAIRSCSGRTSRRLRPRRAIRCTCSAARTTIARSTSRSRPMTTKKPATRGSGSSSRSTAASAGPARCCRAIRRISRRPAWRRRSRAIRPAPIAVVRAGTHGLIYYSGLVFDRGDERQERDLPRALHRQQQPGSGDPFALSRHHHRGARPPARRSSTSRGWPSTFRATTRRSCTVTDAAAFRPRRQQDRRAGSTTAEPKPPPDVQRIPAGADLRRLQLHHRRRREPALRDPAHAIDRLRRHAGRRADPRQPSGGSVNQGAYDRDRSAYRRRLRRVAPFRLLPRRTTHRSDLDAMMVAALPYRREERRPAGPGARLPEEAGPQRHRKLDSLFEHRGKKEVEIRRRPARSTSSIRAARASASAPTPIRRWRPTAPAASTWRGRNAASCADTARRRRRAHRHGHHTATGAPSRQLTAGRRSRCARPRPPADAVDDVRRRQADAGLLRPARDAGARLPPATCTIDRSATPTRAAAHHRHPRGDGAAGDAPNFAPSVQVSDYLMGIQSRDGADRSSCRSTRRTCRCSSRARCRSWATTSTWRRRRRSCPAATASGRYNTAATGAAAGLPRGVDRQPRRAAAAREPGDGNSWTEVHARADEPEQAPRTSIF